MGNDICDLDPALQSATDEIAFVSYRILTPFYFVIAITGHSIFIASFRKQYKKEKAYGYQIFASASDLLEVLAVTLCMLTRNDLSGYRLPGALWFEDNYALMWFAAHLASPLELSCIATSLLIYVSMAVDRVFAIANPFKYRTIRHTHHQVVAVTLCAVIGFSVSVFDAFRDELQKVGDHYIITSNTNYTETTLAEVLAWLRTSVFIGGDVALTICNIAMIICYRLSLKKQGLKKKPHSEKEVKAKKTQKTLVMLTICQSTFTTINMTMNSIYYSFVYSESPYLTCVSKVLSPIVNLVMLSGGILELIAMLFVYENFRNGVFDVLSCKNRRAGICRRQVCTSI